MGALFSSEKGGKKKPEVTSRDRAILDLKVQRDKLKQYRKKIEHVISKEHESARALVKAGKKKQAALLLKKKRYQEQLLDKTDGQMLNLEEMVNTIEFALVEQKVLDGLKSGNEVLKDIQNQMSLEDVEKIMDDTRDAIAYQEEVEQLMGSVLSPEDDAACMAELEELAAMETDAELSKAPIAAGDALPDVAAEPEKQKQKEKEKEGEKGREMLAA